MSEKKLYKDFKKNWSGYIARIETKFEDGFPDLHIVKPNKHDSFIELKYLAREFKNCVLPIKMDQFRWHLNYKGFFGFMLFQVEKEYYLFRSEDISNLKGKISWKTFENNCRFNHKELKEIINQYLG